MFLLSLKIYPSMTWRYKSYEADEEQGIETDIRQLKQRTLNSDRSPLRLLLLMGTNNTIHTSPVATVE